MGAPPENKIFVTQGTVHLKRIGGKWKVIVEPVCDYKIKHGGRDYTVFVNERDGESKEALVRSGVFELSLNDDHIVPILKESAFNHTKVELLVEALNNGELTIVGATVPATVATTR